MLTLDTCFPLIRLLLANTYGCIGFRMRLRLLSLATVLPVRSIMSFAW